MTRAYGWKKDLHDPTVPRFAASRLNGLAKRPLKAGLAAPDLRPYRGAPIRQLSVNSCVGCAISRAIQMSLRIQGFDGLPAPSPMFTYFAARAQEHAGEPPSSFQVADVGCYPSLAMQATQKVGFLAEDAWPYREEDRNTPPSPAMILSAYGQKALAWYAIERTGDDKVADAIDALRHGYPAIWGAQVDEAFEWHSGEEIVTSFSHGPKVGGHMMCLLAADEKNNRFLTDNWWSTDEQPWGREDGTAWVSMDLFSSDASDVSAIVAASPY